MKSLMSRGAGSGSAGRKTFFLAAAALLLAAGCNKPASVQSNTSATVQGSNQTASAQNSQTSLKALMALGAAQKCTVNFSSNSSQSQGTIYLDGGKMRGDFTVKENGNTQSSHMINNGTTIYTWVDGNGMAMKMSVSAMQQLQSTSTAQSTRNPGVDPNADYQYNCSPWTADSSLFTAPAGINFMDESQMMMQMHPGSQSGSSAGSSASASASIKTQECAACNSAGANKAQCLAAMHC